MKLRSRGIKKGANQITIPYDFINSMNWTVYILECANGSLYTGITKDLTRRITEHETGKGACYTAGRSPYR
ncbi:GIY-YIG catalytic domain-containing protein [Nitrosomonas aestuarii]|uniref:GIY-YIG catalytic domain-containing protein n=1 Tax=Nitrosomonas aestuarii TaxID=52441 RepID=A0A1I4H8B9_9PROT|nr:GIY-YIG nuclease family protein [Nitrosomonas aestuarii]SFL38552.1 GIY-YIG catalytic domain-containing protein [Nitrosomonas aestuarii]